MLGGLLFTFTRAGMALHARDKDGYLGTAAETGATIAFMVMCTSPLELGLVGLHTGLTLGLHFLRIPRAPAVLLSLMALGPFFLVSAPMVAAGLTLLLAMTSSLLLLKRPHG